MNNMLARLTADGFLHRLAFDGRSTLRCVSPEISSNPSASRQLIKKYSIQKNVKAERRVHKKVKAQFTRELNLSSQECEAEISNRETEKRNDDDDQLKLHAQVATTPSVVVASSWPDNDDEPAEIVEKLTEKLKLSYDQSKKVQFYLDQDGKGYVLEKVSLTRSKDLRNAGGFFMQALEKDYREPVKNVKPAPLTAFKGNQRSRYGQAFQTRLSQRQKRKDWLDLSQGPEKRTRIAPERVFCAHQVCPSHTFHSGNNPCLTRPWNGEKSFLLFLSQPNSHYRVSGHGYIPLLEY